MTPVEPPAPPAERGRTRVTERVVAKLAVQAAREALRTAPEVRAQPALPRRPGQGTTATAVVSRAAEPAQGAGSARVRVLIELGYPSDIGAQCRAVRRQVVARIAELADMQATEVAVAVERLHSAHGGGDSSGRVR